MGRRNCLTKIKTGTKLKARGSLTTENITPSEAVEITEPTKVKRPKLCQQVIPETTSETQCPRSTRLQKKKEADPTNNGGTVPTNNCSFQSNIVEESATIPDATMVVTTSKVKIISNIVIRPSFQTVAIEGCSKEIDTPVTDAPACDNNGVPGPDFISKRLVYKSRNRVNQGTKIAPHVIQPLPTSPLPLEDFDDEMVVTQTEVRSPQATTSSNVDDETLAVMLHEFDEFDDQNLETRLQEIGLRDELAAARAVEEADVEAIRNREDQRQTYLEATRRDVHIFHLGNFNLTCPSCGARYFRTETINRGVYTRCCANGKINLAEPLEIPELIGALFARDHLKSNDFLKHVLQYNNAFQFISTQVNLRTLRGRGPYIYAVEGKMYHSIGDINVSDEGNSKYGPLYFLDPEYAVERRMQLNNNKLDRVLVRDLGETLATWNPLAQGYMHLKDVYETKRQQMAERGEPGVPNVQLEIINTNGRQYNQPQIREIACVYVCNETRPPYPNLGVFIKNQYMGLRRVGYYDKNLDALLFPLLFPRGDLGWHADLLHADGRRRVTLCEFYAFKLAYRPRQLINHGGKLTQQYVVNAYVKIEQNNINFIVQNQNQLRASEYVGLADYLHNQAEMDNVPMGRMVILPSTYNRGPRAYQQRYQDFMATVAKFGAPSAFITMTCNPKWTEIVENIPIGDENVNHPMLVARIFHAKLNELIDDLLEKHIFGVPLACVYVIEFQKRGLPHAHILLILRDQDKLNNAVRIDQLISAEIPDSQIEPVLYDLVKQHMTHGPCGSFNPSSICMEQNKCSKHFPQPLAAETVVSEDGSVIYRRRISLNRVPLKDENREIKQFNCQWIVPYSPYLLFKYRCHINVMACSSLRSVKYLCKYLNKGADRALVRVVEQNQQQAPAQANNNQPLHALQYNEVEAYLNARYMTPPEAAWHINKFEIHKMTHTVIRLQLHLPERQRVVFERGMEREALARNERTMLTDWFRLNTEDPTARPYLYQEIPNHFVWVAGDKRWKKRLRRGEKTISRMYSVSLRDRELFFLRTLLLHVRGATSYESVRTFEETIYETFEQTCRARGLLADDAEWIRCLEEAIQKDMPYQLRQMFAYILAFCEVNDPSTLWERFRLSLIEDFTRNDMVENLAENAGLLQIQTTLLMNGRRLREFNIREPIAQNILEDDPVNVEQEQAEGERLNQQLNPQQRTAFDAVIAAVHNDDEPRRLFYLNGPGGSGKTFLYNTIITVIRGENMPVASMAWTGLAAALLKQGRTTHSRFKLPVPLLDTSTSSLTLQSAKGQFIRRVKLIVWDEVSMASRYAFDIVDKTLKDLCQNNLPFGGKVMLVGGDFRQCLPIVTHGDRTQIVEACIKQSIHWHLFETLDLTVNVRAINDQSNFSEWLLQLGSGTLDGIRYGEEKLISIPAECVVENLNELIRKVFGTLQVNDVPHKAILTPLNEDCHTINDIVCKSFPGESKTYFSADSVVEDDDETLRANYSIEFLNTLTPPGAPAHKLTLKRGVIVMLLRNLNVKKGLCNGTRLLVRTLCRNFIDAEILDARGNLTGNTVFIPRIDIIPTDADLPFKMKRRQFPLRLSYAITINKSQGQTYDGVGIYLKRPVFAHGQLYVAFSRAKTLNSVFVFVEATTLQGKLLQENPMRVYTRNVVYPEALQ